MSFKILPSGRKVIPFYPVRPWNEDRFYRPIPNTENIWIDKHINRDQLTAFVRSMHEQSILIEWIEPFSRSSIHKTVEEIGTERVLKKRGQFIREADFQKKWNDAAVKFQKKLLEVEPLGKGVTDTVTIPDHSDIVTYNAMRRNNKVNVYKNKH